MMFADEVAATKRAGVPWWAVLRGPEFVDGSRLIAVVRCRTSSGSVGAHVLFEAPRPIGAPARPAEVLEEEAAVRRVMALLADGWTIDVPWAREPSAQSWWERVVGGSTLRPQSMMEVAQTIEHWSISRWTIAEQSIDLDLLAGKMRVGKITLWTGGPLWGVGFAVGYPREEVVSVDERRLLLGRLDLW
jgi:hypothetical protein